MSSANLTRLPPRILPQTATQCLMYCQTRRNQCPCATKPTLLRGRATFPRRAANTIYTSLRRQPVMYCKRSRPVRYILVVVLLPTVRSWTKHLMANTQWQTTNHCILAMVNTLPNCKRKVWRIIWTIQCSCHNVCVWTTDLRYVQSQRPTNIS